MSAARAEATALRADEPDMKRSSSTTAQGCRRVENDISSPALDIAEGPALTEKENRSKRTRRN